MPEVGAASSSARPTWLFVLPWSPDAVGGVNQVVLSLAAEMRKSGRFRPLLLVTDWNAPEPVCIDDDRLPVVRWRVRATGQGLGDKLRHLHWRLGFQRRFEAFCQEHRVAVLNPHYVGDTSLSLQRIAEGFRQPPPVLFSFHGADLTAIEESARAREDWHRAVRHPRSAMVACSTALAHRLQQALAAEPKVVHNGVDMDALSLGASPQPAPARRTILSIGKFEAKKGQSTLLHAFARIESQFTDTDLLLIGAEGPELPALRALAEKLGIADRTRFAVNVPHAQIGSHFASATLFALPSRQEPFGLVILEAAAFGLPVIASRVGGIPEIIRDESLGRLVEPDQVQALADGLLALLSDAEASSAMGARLRKDARHRFSWQKTALGYETALADLG